MHILGKVLVWLVVIAVLPAVLLSVKMLDVQNSWTKKADDLRKQNEQRAESLAELEEKQAKLQADLALATMGVGRYWLKNSQNQAVGVRVTNPQTGELEINIGTNDGIPQVTDANGAAVNPVLYAFRPDGTGSFAYVGPFVVARPADNTAFVVPFGWRPQQGETGTWASNPGGWHFRTDIPIEFKTRFIKLAETERMVTRNLIAGNANLQRQQASLQDATDKLAERQGQLLGPANPPAEPALGPEFRIGLVPAIEVEEERRNRELAEQNRLRHLLKQAHDQLNRLISENQAMVRQLPQPEAPAVSNR